MSTAKVFTTEGRVRRVQLDESPAAGEFALISIAGDPERYVDFDDPGAWAKLRGCHVCLQWVESANAQTSYVYRRVLDVWEAEDD